MLFGGLIGIECEMGWYVVGLCMYMLIVGVVVLIVGLGDSIVEYF